jgi:L-ascorbate metabolism protein UlaG (beta-lactamase superfamily)
MRLKLGRPDLGQYADRFDVPAADGDFAVTFLGVSTLLIDDGESAVLTDGYFSRPSLAKVGLGKIAPDHDRIDAALARTRTTRLAGVLPVHTHFDHALDSAVVAEQTGALLVGGESTANVGRGGGLPQERLRVVSSGESMQLGGFDSPGSSPTTAHPTASPAPSPTRSSHRPRRRPTGAARPGRCWSSTPAAGRH